MKSENDIDKLFENNQGYPRKGHIPDDYWSDLDDKLDAERIDKLFTNNQGYAHVENIPDDFLNDLDNALDRTEQDNLFKNNQGYSKGNKIPRDFLDDLDSRLDDNASFYKRLISVSALRKIMVATGIAAIVFYFLVDKKENTEIIESNHSENNTTISGNNISATPEPSPKNELSDGTENTPDSLHHSQALSVTEETTTLKKQPAEQAENNLLQSDIKNNKTAYTTTGNKAAIESIATNKQSANKEKRTTTASVKYQQTHQQFVSKTDNKQQKNIGKAYTQNTQQASKNVALIGAVNTEKAWLEENASSKNNTSLVAEKAGSTQNKTPQKSTKEEVKNNTKTSNADTLSTGLLSGVADTAVLNNTLQANNVVTQPNDTKSQNTVDTTTINQAETISLSDTMAITDSLNIAKADTLLTKDTLATTVEDSSAKPPVVPQKDIANGAIKSLQVNIGAMQVQSSFLSQNVNYDTKRKNEEKPIVVNDVSVLFNYRKYNIIISSGVNYGQWGEKINYNSVTDSVVYIVKYDTVRTVNIENPKYVSVDTRINPVTGKRADENTEIIQKNGINKYSYLHVPVLVGYVIGKNKFLITPKIGCLIGIPLKNKGGYYINTDINSLVEEAPQKWILNYQAEIEFRYNNFVISPYYRQNAFNLINSATTSNKYSGLGIQVGYVVFLR